MTTTEARTVTGVVGTPWRADVTAWGAVVPWDDPRPLDWFVAAEDRWHVPSDEPSVRQRRIDGTAVVETRIGVPRGDVVHRVASFADHGGVTVIEVANESPMAVAVAFDRSDVLTARPVGDVPIRGIELPAGSFVVPVAHGASVRVGLAHDGRSGPHLPDDLPPVDVVVSGWRAVVDRASRFVLPPGSPGAATAERVAARRCDVLLGEVPRADDDPASFAVALGELTRLGHDADPWLPELVEAVDALARTRSWAAEVGLRAAHRVLVAAGEDRAERDLDRILGRRVAPAPVPDAEPDGVLAVPWLERTLAAEPGVLLPRGFPPAWLGAGVEAFGLPVGRSASLSYAVRWHGARPAVLWERTGDESVTLSAPAVDPSWRTDAATGEALWAAPSVPSGVGSSVTPGTEADGAVGPGAGSGPDPGAGPISFG